MKYILIILLLASIVFAQRVDELESIQEKPDWLRFKILDADTSKNLRFDKLFTFLADSGFVKENTAPVLDATNFTNMPETSPLTTDGDLYYYSSGNDRLPVGANGKVLKSNGTTVEWGDVSTTISGGRLPDDVTTDTTVAGALKVHDNYFKDQFVQKINLFNYETVTAGYYIKSTTGILTASANYSASDYIPVEGDSTYTRSTGDTNYAWYTSDSTYISVSTTSAKTITAPSNAAYTRQSIYKTSDLIAYTFILGTSQKKNENYGYYLSNAYLTDQSISLNNNTVDWIGESYGDESYYFDNDQVDGTVTSAFGGWGVTIGGINATFNLVKTRLGAVTANALYVKALVYNNDYSTLERYGYVSANLADLSYTNDYDLIIPLNDTLSVSATDTFKVVLVAFKNVYEDTVGTVRPRYGDYTYNDYILHGDYYRYNGPSRYLTSNWREYTSTTVAIDIGLCDSTNVEKNVLIKGGQLTKGPDYIKSKTITEIKANVLNDNFGSRTIALPDTLYFASTLENSIYYNEVCSYKAYKGNCPWVSADIGSCYELFWRWTPSSAITDQITFALYNFDDFSEYDSKDVDVIVSDITDNSALKWLTIGDSWTHTNNWQIMIDSTISSVDYIGSRCNADTNKSNIYNEGRGGFTIDSYVSTPTTIETKHWTPFVHPDTYTYYGSTGWWLNVVADSMGYHYEGFMDLYRTLDIDISGYPSSPSLNDMLYDNSASAYKAWDGDSWETVTPENWAVDFDKYLTFANVYTPTVVTIMLTTNTYKNILPNTTFSSTYRSWKADIDTLIAGIHRTDLNIKIGVVTIPYPGNETLAADPSLRPPLALKETYHKLAKNIYSDYGGRGNENIFVIAGHSAIDKYNTETTTVTPFSRYTGANEIDITDLSIHPDNDMYNAIADRIIGFLQYAR